jgi:hypothetical protein
MPGRLNGLDELRRSGRSGSRPGALVHRDRLQGIWARLHPALLAVDHSFLPPPTLRPRFRDVERSGS